MDSTGDPDQEYIYFMESETLPSDCYMLSHESGIPFCSTSNGYKKSRLYRIFKDTGSQPIYSEYLMLVLV